MITTYAVSFSTVDCTEDERIALIDLVTDWQVDHHPVDSEEDDAGRSVRTRLASGDPVFRVTVTDAAPQRAMVTTTTVTVTFVGSTLTFDLRVVATPRARRIAPNQPPLPEPHVIDLVRAVLAAVPTRDAQRPVVDRISSVSDVLGAQEIAYFLLAPQRCLPVVVEVVDFERGTAPLMGAGLGPLAGLVHMVRITTPEALAAYVEIARLPLIGPDTVVVHWAADVDPLVVHGREIVPARRTEKMIEVVRRIITVAAGSVAPPRTPPPPRDDSDPDSVRNVDAVSGDEDLVVRAEQLEATVDELQAAMADADRIISEQREELERLGQTRDVLIQRNVELEIRAGEAPRHAAVSSMREAIEIAVEHCQFLHFHPRAIETGMALQGPEPMAVLKVLAELDQVAREWMAGEINGSSIKLECRKRGLKFAPGVSDTAEQKYDSDYLIEWNGRTVLAGAHVSRGKKAHLLRIYMWLDEESQEIVVAHIGRHLRDKHSAH